MKKTVAIEKTIEKNKLFFLDRKIILFTVLSVLVITSLFCFVICCICSNISENGIKSYISEVSTHYASSIENKIQFYLNTENYYREIVSNFNAVDVHSRRKYYINVTKKFLNTNSAILSYWLDFDENTCDGLDAQYHNHKYFNEVGRFSVCWNREDIGYAYTCAPMEEVMEELNTDYIRLPRQLRKTVVVEPYFYSYDEQGGKERIPMTSIASPIFDKDSNVIGVSAIDISLDSIINLITKINLYGVNRGALLSSQGKYLSYSDTSLIDKFLTSSQELQSVNVDSVMNLIQKNKKVNLDFVDKIDNRRKIIHIIPIQFKDKNMWLNLKLIFYYDVVMADSMRFTFDIIIYFTVAIFIIVVIIVISSIMLNNSTYKLLNLNYELQK